MKESIKELMELNPMTVQSERLKAEKKLRLLAARYRKARLAAMTPWQRRKAIRASKAASKARKESLLRTDW